MRRREETRVQRRSRRLFDVGFKKAGARARTKGKVFAFSQVHVARVMPTVLMAVLVLCSTCLVLCGCDGTVGAGIADSAGAAGTGAAGAAGTKSRGSSITGEVSTMLDIDDPAEKEAVSIAMEKTRYLGREPRIVGTSPAVVEICDKLELDLAGICESTLFETPSRYESAEKVGPPMSPDMELVGALAPDWILSPNSLQADLQPKYEAIGADFAFLNLKSVQGMYRSIQELGEIFDRRDQARELVEEFSSFYRQFQAENAAKKRPSVLVLMGMPGSYVIATENSYVGNLVELAGGENVYSGATEDFLTVNTEDMQSKDPDIILRCSHALPDQVRQMFADEFESNDIWKHFRAVEEGRVYDLPYDLFGMSATFDYPEALEHLQGLLYVPVGSTLPCAAVFPFRRRKRRRGASRPKRGSVPFGSSKGSVPSGLCWLFLGGLGGRSPAWGEGRRARG